MEIDPLIKLATKSSLIHACSSYTCAWIYQASSHKNEILEAVFLHSNMCASNTAAGCCFGHILVMDRPTSYLCISPSDVPSDKLSLNLAKADVLASCSSHHNPSKSEIRTELSIPLQHTLVIILLLSVNKWTWQYTKNCGSKSFSPFYYKAHPY